MTPQLAGFTTYLFTLIAILETVTTVNRAVGVQGRLEGNQERLVTAG